MFRAWKSTDEEGRRHRLNGYGAVTRADAKDARRRRPASSLEEWAAARGLDHLGTQNAAGYFAVLPLDDQLQFNVVRGTLPGGRDGCLFHWLRPWPVGQDGDPINGSFVEEVWNPGWASGYWKKMIPIAGHFMANDVELSIGVPCTVAATNVPEAAMLKQLPKELHARLKASGPNTPLYEVRLRFGTVAVVRNGWPDDPDELDALAAAASEAGEAVRAACLAAYAEGAGSPVGAGTGAPGAGSATGASATVDAGAGAASASRRRFADPLPAVDWPPSGISLSGRFPASPWLEALHALAAELTMELEEPAAHHAAFPSLPVPGRPFAVMRGTLPGTSVPARIAFHQERSLSDNQGRTALLLAAAPGASETPPHGVRNAAPGLSYGVRDGVVAIWTLRSSGRNGDLGDVAGLLRDGFAFAVGRGLAAG